MIYLFLGEGGAAKDRKISETPKKILSSPEALKFDCDIFYGNNLEPVVLKKALISLPAIAPKRLVVIREAGKLSAHNQQLILEAVQRKDSVVDIILDIEKESGFVTEVAPYAQITRFQEQTPLNVFDMTRAIGMSKSVEAFEILSGLWAAGIHPLQIMGGLVWFWEKSRPGLSRERFRKGLLALQEADLNIKRSRLDPQYAIEVLIAKLMEK